MKLNAQGQLCEDIVLDFVTGNAPATVAAADEKPRMVKCACGSWRWPHIVPHAPRWNSRHELVDCLGVVIREAP